ncbi:LysM peptidoglycan-binding domain-containing protein [Cellulosimicrobium cellulans]|uniref:LysM peptidoglycan-binding domain-containing protein n=1 Tax=Cellulosimicrobium cellulans TaxID=1710 RepID=UPI0008486F76|nr:LysM domain-containing protein [Cellulosimicrobium cellulans]
MRGSYGIVAGAAVVLLAGTACTGGSPDVPDPPPTATATATVRLTVPDGPVREVQRLPAPDRLDADAPRLDPPAAEGPGASDDVRDRLPESPPVDSGARGGASGTVVLLDTDGAPTTYFVVEGDDLSSIALRFYPEEELGSALNRLIPQANGQPLQPGQKIYLW